MTFSESDIQLVAQRAGISESQARRALQAEDGDLAGAIKAAEKGNITDKSTATSVDRTTLTEDDVQLVAHRVDISESQARRVLRAEGGDLAGAIKAAEEGKIPDKSRAPSADTNKTSATGSVPSSDQGGSTGRNQTADRSKGAATNERQPDNNIRFGIPDNEHFLQKLEARGRDGQATISETVYVLTGQTQSQVSELIPLDNEAYYDGSSPMQVSFDAGAMAREVARSYPGGSPPQLIAWFHTHPGGIPQPSPGDQQSADGIYQRFVDAFGTDSFEFVQGIHSLTEHNRTLRPANRRQPVTRNQTIKWDDERYRHHVAVYGPQFRTRIPVAVR